MMSADDSPYFFSKIGKDVAKFVVCCIRDWHFKRLIADWVSVLQLEIKALRVLMGTAALKRSNREVVS